MNTKTPSNPPLHSTAQMRRRNIATALVLAVFALSLAASVFLWRYAHNQPAIPQGGSYGATYQVQE